MKPLITKKYLAEVELVFEDQVGYDSDRAAGITLKVPVGDRLNGTCMFVRADGTVPVGSVGTVPTEFIHQLRYLEAVQASDGKSETIEAQKKEFMARRSHGVLERQAAQSMQNR